jgi:hypothetical protein
MVIAPTTRHQRLARLIGDSTPSGRAQVQIHDRTGDQPHENANRRSEGPVIADEHGVIGERRNELDLGAAEQRRKCVRGESTARTPAANPIRHRKAQRQRDPKERLHRRCAGSARGFLHVTIDLLERGKDRHDHERQQHLHQREHHRVHRVQHAHRLVDDAQRLQSVLSSPSRPRMTIHPYARTTMPTIIGRNTR